MIEEELSHDENYIRIVNAVINSAVTDYVKLAHPKNRNKKYLQESFNNSISMFFDETYRINAFTCLLDEKPFTTKELLSILISTPGVSMEKARQHVINESIKYWWEKNFNDIKIPSSINIFGRVYSIHIASKEHIDYEKGRIYFPVKKIGSDRIFFKLSLKIILREAEIELEEEEFDKLHKVFYLFLKINNAF
tara:strand:+ start:2578 stop:3156 length:579 start_codon:yes stop_codon:yes gene_type:complete